MRYEKHDLDFSRYVVLETLNQLSEKYVELPTDFCHQVEELKRTFQADLQQSKSGNGAAAASMGDEK